MTVEPKSLTVGQLSDDLASLDATSDIEPAIVGHELAHLAGLVRAPERLAKP
jgi:hypothetical protein